MTNELLNAFWNLRRCEREAILRSMRYTMTHHIGEQSIDFCTRVVRQICNDGRVRDLEEEMRRFQ